MKVLDPGKYVVLEIDDSETIRFERFLDRNFPGWRERQTVHSRERRDAVTREWNLDVGDDDIERTAFYRLEFVEISDCCITLEDGEEEPDIRLMKHRICDIDGDSTPVAVWDGRSGQT